MKQQQRETSLEKLKRIQDEKSLKHDNIIRLIRKHKQIKNELAKEIKAWSRQNKIIKHLIHVLILEQQQKKILEQWQTNEKKRVVVVHK